MNPEPVSEPTHPAAPDSASVASDAPQPTSATPPREEGGRLQRQTFVMVNDRGRMVLLVALCTLAGVGVGFALAMMVNERAACPSHHLRIPAAGFAASPFLVPSAPVPPAPPAPPGCGRFDGSHRHGVHVWDGDHGIHIWEHGMPFFAGEEDEEAFLGVHLADGDRGARVVGVRAGSPAAAAGIQVDDVVVEFDGEPVAEPADLVALVRGATPGDKVALEVVRAKVERRIEAVLASLADRLD
jgi:membrane-associated protease RseP (regulator of RpoE activity)